MKKLLNGKKAVACLCAVVMLLSSAMAALPSVVSAVKQKEIWDGSKAESYAGGDGSAENPYLIKTPAQLYRAIYAGKENGVNISDGKYYRMENDIYLNDVSADDWYTKEGLHEWVKLDSGKEIGDFRGVFDGNGYVVHGLYYSDTADYAALIPKTGSYTGNAVVIKNVGIEDAYVQGKYTGALVGCVDGSRNGKNTITVSACYADDSVYLKGSQSSGLVAWLFNYYFTMENCASRVRMIGTPNTSEPRGSLLGAMWLNASENGGTNVDNAKKITIKSSYAVLHYEDRNAGFSAVPQSWPGRHVRYENVHGGLYPNRSGGAVFNGSNYTLNNQIGCEFGHWSSDFLKEILYTGFSSDVWMPGNGADRYLTPKIFSKNIVDWNGGEPADEGTGTKDEPYKIKNAKQLYWAINQGDKSVGKYYKLQNNIEITDTSVEDWEENAVNWVFPGGQSFRGHLDGDGFTVKGMLANGGNPALIPTVNSDNGEVTIENIGLEASVSRGTGNTAGALIGVTVGSHNVTVSCCYAAADVKIDSSDKVGLVAQVNGGNLTMENCFTLAEQSGGGANKADELYNGSLVGDVYGGNNAFDTVYIKNSYAVESPGYAAVCQNWSGARCHFTNVYGTVEPKNDGKFYFWNLFGVKRVDKDKMTDESAISAMPGLDFENVWMPIKGGFPKQQIFEKGSAGGEISFEGEGTRDNPYLIKTTEQLNALRNLSSKQTSGKYYRLENDLDFTGISCEMNIAASFNGYFNGNGHTISGMVINEPETGNTALFGKLGRNAALENLRITNSEFTGKTAAAFVGTVAGENVMLSRLFADSTVKINGSSVCGGIVGMISQKNFTLTGCGFTGKLTGGTEETPKGGLVGASAVSGVRNTISCSYTATVDGDPAISPAKSCSGLRFVGIYSTGSQTFGSSSGSSNITKLSRSDMLGSNARKNMPMLDFDSVWIEKSGTTPVLRLFETEPVPVIKGTEGKVWSGKIATGYSGGTGEIDDPYLISTGEQLALLASTAVRAPMMTVGRYYKLTADIILNDTSKNEWYLGTDVNSWFYDYSYSSFGFNGHFDGAGHSVSGICNNSAAVGSYGLFGALGGSAVVENVAVKNLYIANGDSANGTHVGSIAGFISQTADRNVKIQIKNCIADSTNVLRGNTNGGILGHACMGVIIKNCLSQAIPFAKHSNGSIVGVCDSPTATEITNCLVIEGLNDKTVAFWMTDAAWAASQATPIVTNTYSTFSSTDVPAIGRSKLMGKNAEKVLIGFDFEDVWMTVDGGTPTLRVFNGGYSQPRKKVTISFYTDGGTTVNEIKGYPGDTIPWPSKANIKRDADIFDGWYLEIQHLREYPLDVFPEYDIVLFAKWIEKTIKQDFETYPYSDEGFEGLGFDYERYRPGVLGFDFSKVHDGMTSIHRKGTDPDAGEQDFAVFQDDMDPLEIGKEYTLSFWVYAETVGNASDMIKLAHTDYLDIDEPIYYLEDICSLGSLKNGEWQEVKLKFTANAYYIAIRTPGMSSLYFDSFRIVPTDSPVLKPVKNGIGTSGSGMPTTGEQPPYITVSVLLASAMLVVVLRRKAEKK